MHRFKYTLQRVRLEHFTHNSLEQVGQVERTLLYFGVFALKSHSRSAELAYTWCVLQNPEQVPQKQIPRSRLAGCHDIVRVKGGDKQGSLVSLLG